MGSSSGAYRLPVAAWNALLLVTGLALLAACGELWLRTTMPFAKSSVPREFVPGGGLLGKPGAAVRFTNRLDFWTVSRFNRLGFLDREPPDAAHSNPPRPPPPPPTNKATCHVTVIGDSFVEALEVPIAAKIHVRLEALAAQRLEAMDVSTSAFGQRATGQLNQLAFYDAFARKRSPELTVLVFVANDYADNSPLLTALRRFRSPRRLPWMSAERTATGLRLRRPAQPEPAELLRQRRGAAPGDVGLRQPMTAATEWLARWSYFGGWLDAKANKLLRRGGGQPNLLAWAGVLRQEHRAAGPLFDAWPLTDARSTTEPFGTEPLPTPYAAELDYTAFAFRQFRRRADEDGSSLLILAAHDLLPGTPLYERMLGMANDFAIPVVSLAGYVLHRGGRIQDLHWRHDYHWNPAGHQWAAEAILDWLERHPGVCAGQERMADGVNDT